MSMEEEENDSKEELITSYMYILEFQLAWQ